jgi:hypothetical protein
MDKKNACCVIHKLLSLFFFVPLLSLFPCFYKFDINIDIKNLECALRVCWKGPAKTLLTGRFLVGPLTWLKPRHRSRLPMASIRSSQCEESQCVVFQVTKASTYTLGGDTRRAGGSYGQHKKTASIR